MCGIAGLLGRLDARNLAAVTKMSGALEHRGPDGAGMWSSTADDDGWGCLLAHRRLSVLDLSAAADQPMTHPDTGQTLVYNGELYDYADHRDALAAHGEQVRSSGDTEVLLRRLARDGVAVLPQLGGMFAFGLWDPRDRTLLLARDQLGIKPLYVARNPDPQGTWSMAFASELRALLRSGLVARRLDPAAAASMTWNGYVAGPGTAVRDVESLPAGAWRRLSMRPRREQQQQYWSLGAAAASGGPTTVPDVSSALRESVGRHLVSDVPLGVFLSSGVDSSAVTALAQASLELPLRTFTLTFEEQEHSEAPEARRVAAAIGTEHREIVLTARDFEASLAGAVASLDQPTFDGLNSLHMSRAVKAAGLTVALVGTGGDELFGGYNTFRDLPRLHRAAGGSFVPGAVRRAAAAAVRQARPARGSVPPQTRWAKLPHMLAAADDLVSLYQLSYALFLPETQRRLLLDGVPVLADGLSGELGAALRAEIAGLAPLRAVSRLEQRMFLGERLLRDSDAAAMTHSLELRLPLVDARLAEAVERLPLQQRYAPVGRKQVLRTAGLAGLDPALLDHPKRGFELPYDAWLRGRLGQTVAEVLTDAAACRRAGFEPAGVRAVWDGYRSGAPGLYWTRVWALYAHVAWTERHAVHL